MGLTNEVSNSCIYDTLEKILKMINEGNKNEEIKLYKIKTYIENEMKKCSNEM